MRRRTAAAAGALALCVCGVVLLAGRLRSASVDGLLEGDAEGLWAPHEGPLTAMLRARRVQRGAARTQQLTWDDRLMSAAAAHRARGRGHGRAGADSAAAAARWAQQMLRTGGSLAERKGRTNLVTADYANTHAGYTSSVPETRSGRGVYDFASQISSDAHARQSDRQVGAARTMELAEAAHEMEAEPAEQLDAPRRAAALSPPLGATAAIREARARDTTKAWKWAGDREHAAKGAAGTGAATLGPASASAAVTESADTPEQKSWSWAASVFSDANRHRSEDAAMASRSAAARSAAAPRTQARSQAAPRRQLPLADFAAPAAPAAAAAAATGRAEPTGVRENPRRARILAARAAIGELHRTSQDFEHARFQHARSRAARRARALSERDDSLERAADAGAAAEVGEYAAIASLGIPSGSHSAKAGDARPAMSMRALARRGARDRRVDPLWSERARRRLAGRRRRAADEERDVTADTNFIFGGGLSGERGRGAGRIGAAARIAADEEAAYQRGFEAGIAAEEKAVVRGRGGGREGRAAALSRQARRAKKARKTAEDKAETKMAQEQSLANTSDGADADFQVTLLAASACLSLEL